MEAETQTKRKPAPYVRYTEEAGEAVARAYAAGMGLEEMKARKGMPDPLSVYAWEETHPEFSQAFARARRAKAQLVAHKAGAVLEACDPDAEPARSASARVTLATSKSNYYRWLAGCLDRNAFGDALKVAAEVQVQGLVAFADLTQAATLAAEARRRQGHPPLPHVAVPDGGAEEA